MGWRNHGLNCVADVESLRCNATVALHDDEIPIDVDLVRELVAASFPAYTALEVWPLDQTGSSNRLFRLGDDLLVRLPRQRGGSSTLGKEQRWVPKVAPGLAVAVPQVIGVGEPGFGYPEQWSITQWLPGSTPRVGRSGGSALVEGLAGVVNEMRAVEVSREARSDQSLRWYRGESLTAVDEDFWSALDACASLPGLDLDLTAVGKAWRSLLAHGGSDADPQWYHGDLLAENLLVDESGRLSAVLDFGGLGVGDPSVDAMVAWELFDRSERESFAHLVGADERSWRRSMGWALFVAVVTFPYYWHTMPGRCQDRLLMAQEVLCDLAD